MKIIKLLFLGLIALSISLVGCKKDDKVQPVSYVEDGFYVVGEATAVADLFATNAELGLMAAGINEVGQAVRSGMYEKYVALEGGKEFQFMLKEGANETPYGATLTLSETLDGDAEPPIKVYKGALTEKGAAMTVPTDGLYHIVIDMPLNVVIVAPVEWGVRGAMNGWGFTPFQSPTFNKTTIKYTLTGAEVSSAIGAFKFVYGSGWKIELGGDPIVKVNTNLGNDGGNNGDDMTSKLSPGGPDIGIVRGIYTIELTWTLAKGDVKDGYTAKLTKTGDPEVLYPDNLYMIGADFGDWDWSSDEVVEMIPVYGIEGAFWCVSYFTAEKGFKWATEKSWEEGDNFASVGENVGYELSDGNAVVAEDGLYTVFIDMAKNRIIIATAEVYGMGNCFGSWVAEDHPFVLNADGITMSITTIAENDLRMYTHIPQVAEHVDGDYWWRTEFIIIDGKIVYRGAGGDQERITVEEGKTITLDFKAGTGKIE